VLAPDNWGVTGYQEFSLKTGVRLGKKPDFWKNPLKSLLRTGKTK
jgi:hypothetical protein